jgi:hypothetical protein
MVSIKANEYILQAKNEQCRVFENLNRGIVETDCIEMNNSKKKDIYCTKTKKICKTKDEIWETFNDLTRNFSVKEKKLLSGLSNISRHMSYPEARKIIIKNGWIPNDIKTEGSWSLVKKIRKQWKEVEDCSGVGVGFCQFGFHDKRGNILSVTTAGEWDIDGKMYGEIMRYGVL